MTASRRSHSLVRHDSSPATFAHLPVGPHHIADGLVVCPICGRDLTYKATYLHPKGVEVCRDCAKAAGVDVDD
jgi:hypothetical protein